MNATQRSKFKKQLSKMERELSRKGPRKIQKPDRESQATPAEDEQPLEEMLQSIDSSRNKNLAGALTRIEKALEKIEKSPADYGVCEECGEDIGLGRLEAMPYAELCVNCQAQRDGPRGMPTRRKISDFQ